MHTESKRQIKDGLEFALVMPTAANLWLADESLGTAWATMGKLTHRFLSIVFPNTHHPVFSCLSYTVVKMAYTLLYQ